MRDDLYKLRPGYSSIPDDEPQILPKVSTPKTRKRALAHSLQTMQAKALLKRMGL